MNKKGIFDVQIGHLKLQPGLNSDISFEMYENSIE